MNRRFRNWIWITLVLTLLAAPPAAVRWAQEAGNTTVEIVLDHHQLVQAAAREGADLPLLLARSREAGAVSMAVREATLLRLRDQNRLTLINGSEAVALLEALHPVLNTGGGRPAASALSPDWTYASTPDGDLAQWLYQAWSAYADAGYLSRPPLLFSTPDLYVVAVAESTPRARILPLGFYPEDLAVVEAAGLDVVPVLQEPPLRTAQMFDLALSRWRNLPPARWVLVEHDPAPGYPGVDYPARYDDVGAVLAGLAAEVGLLEDWSMLGYQVARGLREVAEAAGARGIRVQTVQPELRPVLPPDEQIQQHLAAVQERKVRAVYVFPAHTGAAGDGAGAATGMPSFIADLRSALEAGGYRVGQALPFTHEPPAPWTAWVLALPAALAGSLTAARTLHYLGLPLGRAAGAAAVLLPWLCLGGSAALGGEVLLRQVAALLAAVALPLLAVDLLWQALEPGAGPTGAGTAASPAAAAAGAAAAALGGGMLVAALLSTPEFLQVWAYFRGVKLSFAAPLAVLAVWYLGPLLRDLWAAAGSPLAWLRRLPHHRVSLLQALGVLVLVAMAAVIVWRTASIREGLALELALRDLLGDLLVVRPRFKEWLLGWPGLVVLAAVRPPRRSWLFVFASTGALVGVSSVINSFAHVYTPLAVSLWRTLNGMLLGLPLGLLATLLVRRLVGASDPARIC